MKNRRTWAVSDIDAGGWEAGALTTRLRERSIGAWARLGADARTRRVKLTERLVPRFDASFRCPQLLVVAALVPLISGVDAWAFRSSATLPIRPICSETE